MTVLLTLLCNPPAADKSERRSSGSSCCGCGLRRDEQNRRKDTGWLVWWLQIGRPFLCLTKKLAAKISSFGKPTADRQRHEVN
jgi:hypothetical protein